MPDIDPMLEKHEHEHEHEHVPDADVVEDVVMQSYPSPTANGQDNGAPFYHSNLRPDQQSQHELGQQHHEVEHSQQLDEPPTPPRQHHMRTAHISAEELQLAAQLSQGLAHGLPLSLDPNDESSLQHVIARHEMEQHDQDLHHHDDQMHHEDLQHQHHEHQLDQQMDQQLDEHLDQQLDQELDHQLDHQHVLEQQQQQQQSNQDHQPILQSPDDQSLQNHGDEDQQYQQAPSSQYLSDQSHQLQQQQQPLLQPAASMEHLPAHFQQQQQQSDNTPPRKRSKVSRACDECRRKKVKCDAPSETGEEPCSNCRRSSIRCLFSRIPQKRGPSKGYIKELADRIHHIEGKLASEGGNIDSLTDLLSGAQRGSSDLFATTGHSDESNRKRPFSSISGGEFATPLGPRPLQPYQAPADRVKPLYTAASLAPIPTVSANYQDSASATPSRPGAVTDGVALDLNHVDHGQGQDVDEGAFTTYLDVVHPTFPLLAHKKARVDAQLAQCPQMLRDAFVETLHGTVQTFPSFGSSYIAGDLTNASRMITEWEADVTERTFLMNLVHLQTLILTAISTDNYGPPSLVGEHGGASKSSILGRAVGLAYTMRLHIPQYEAIGAESNVDEESDVSVASRAWWTLVILDRLNAIGTATPLFIPNESVVILPRLNTLLGVNAFHLARLSNILGRFSVVALAPPRAMVLEGDSIPLVGSFADLSMELFRELLPEDITPIAYPSVHLLYWHCRLLAYLTSPKAKPSSILWPCTELVNIMAANMQLISPLNHHFFSLATLTLLELAKVETTREEATVLLKELLDSNLAPSTWDANIRDRIAEHIRPTTAQASMEATASQSLQHLADLATATEAEPAKSDPAADPASESVGFDTLRLLQAGYLSAMAEPRLIIAR